MQQLLTDEERKTIIKTLRHIAEENWWADSCEEAADDIERQAAKIERLVNINRDLCLGWEEANREVRELRNELELAQDERRFASD